MTSPADAFEALKRANDEAEAALAALADSPLADQFASALEVYASRRALTAARAADRSAHRSAVADALADLIGDAEPRLRLPR